MLEKTLDNSIMGNDDGQGSIEYMILAVAAVVLGFLVFTLIKNVVTGHQGDLNAAWPSQSKQAAQQCVETVLTLAQGISIPAYLFR